MSMHLAQVNIAKLRYPADDPRVADFVNNLDRINALAERSPGYVWRLKAETGNLASIDPYGDDSIIVNLSVWETPQLLENYVWKTAHKHIYARRGEWFETMEKMHLAMWWVTPGTEPTALEAKERLDHLQANGNSEYAFGWDGLPNVEMWKQARCA